MHTNRIYTRRVVLPMLIGLLSLSLINCSNATKATTTHFKKKPNFTIEVNYQQAQPGDTLFLYVLNPIYPYPHVNDKRHRVFTAIAHQGSFTFKVPAQKAYGYFTIMKSRTFTDRGQSQPIMPLIENQFWEQGDSVQIAISHKETAGGIYGSWKFYGKGSEKYKIRDHVFSMVHHQEVSSPGDYDENFDRTVNGGIKKKRLAYLENKKSAISKAAYESLKADIIYGYSSEFVNLQQYFKNHITTASAAVREEFVTRYTKFSNESLRVKGEGMSTELLANNPTYLRYLSRKYLADAVVMNASYDQKWIYYRIKMTTTGLLREREVVLLFLNPGRTKDTNSIIKDAKHYVKDAYCLRFLQNIQDKGTGTLITDATFYDRDGKAVHISDFKGKVVLLDFWFNGCGACIGVYKELTSKLHMIFKNEPDVVILAINTDRSKQRWLSGIKLGKYTDDTAKNVYTNGMGFEHPFIKENQIPTCPWLILVDRKGVIRSVDGKELFELETLQEAIHALVKE
ncbi:TlpA family protein disulfide reductase [Zhouia sp. PK063]|uniref:TlpA family protein disulfide reductase n=1 Tax=Zhouia sp. PK063 TaxID=3373602 RepID=UPI0037B92CF9